MLTTIRLQHYRSYTDESFELDSGVNIIVGPNASGKTNLLEAIMMLCLGGSYRSREAELVRFDEPWARLDSQTEHGARTVKLVRSLTGALSKEFVIGDQKLQRLLLPKTIPVVLFEPNHLQLLSGSPDLRRDYLDNLLEQLVSGYTTLRRQYKRTLSQRNRLLKQGPAAADSQLFAWNIRLSQLGAEIATARTELVQQIDQSAQELYRNLSGTQAKVSVSYSSSCKITQYSSDMLHKLEASIEKDFARGFTSYGPHRDDIVLLLNGHPLQDVASRGETRTMLLCLKIIELQLLEMQRNQKPVLLLDDVFSELDGARRRALTEVLKGYQTFITTTDADVVVEHFLGSCHVIPLG